MTPHELDQRKQKILNAIVRDYQDSVEPVGSRTLAKTYLPDLSPATIRNEMADLEEEGFITQPHTSAGRIPTDLGYRFYVDRLMKIVKPTHHEEESIRGRIDQYSYNIDEVLHQTAKLLSHTLDYATIVFNFGSQRRLFSAGAPNLLHQPEFRDLEKIEKVLELLEEEEELSELVDEYSRPNEITIKIGAENKIKTIKDCSVVVATYEINHEPIGRIGLIGPTRMHYSKTATLIDYVARELSRVLSHE